MKIGTLCPAELRAICEKGLLLLTITIPEMEVCQIVNSAFSTSAVIWLFELRKGFLCTCMNGNVIWNKIKNFSIFVQHILWPFLLKMIIPQAYTGAVAMVGLPLHPHIISLFCMEVILDTQNSAVLFECNFLVCGGIDLMNFNTFCCYRFADASQNCAGMDLIAILCLLSAKLVLIYQIPR